MHIRLAIRWFIIAALAAACDSKETAGESSNQLPSAPDAAAEDSVPGAADAEAGASEGAHADASAGASDAGLDPLHSDAGHVGQESDAALAPADPRGDASVELPPSGSLDSGSSDEGDGVASMEAGAARDAQVAPDETSVPVEPEDLSIPIALDDVATLGYSPRDTITSLSGEYHGTLHYDDGQPDTPFVMELELGEPFTSLGYPPNTVAITVYPYVEMRLRGFFRFQTEDGTFDEEGWTEVRATSADTATTDPLFRSSELQGTHQVPGGNGSPDDAGNPTGAYLTFRVQLSAGTTQGTIDNEDFALDERGSGWLVVNGPSVGDGLPAPHGQYWEGPTCSGARSSMSASNQA